MDNNQSKRRTGFIGILASIFMMQGINMSYNKQKKNYEKERPTDLRNLYEIKLRKIGNRGPGHNQRKRRKLLAQNPAMRMSKKYR